MEYPWSHFERASWTPSPATISADDVQKAIASSGLSEKSEAAVHDLARAISRAANLCLCLDRSREIGNAATARELGEAGKLATELTDRLSKLSKEAWWAIADAGGTGKRHSVRIASGVESAWSKVDDFKRQLDYVTKLLLLSQAILAADHQKPKWRSSSRRAAAVVFAAILSEDFEAAFPGVSTTYSKGTDEPGAWGIFYRDVAHVSLGWRPADLEGVFEEARIFRLENDGITFEDG